MGNYATIAELKARFEDDAAVAHLTMDDATGTPDTDVLDETLNAAEGDVDSYLGIRYLIPVDVTGSTTLADSLKARALDIAVYHLIARRGQVPEAKTKAFDDAIVWLKSLAAGEVVLPSAETLPATSSREPDAEWGTAGDSSSSNRVWTRGTVANL